MAYAVFTQRDFSKELSSTTIFTEVLDGTNYDTVSSDTDLMRNAIDGITTGIMATQTLVAEKEVLSSAIPTNVYAQRELKWKVNYHDNVTSKPYTLTLPCADPTGRLLAGTDLANLAQTEVAAFVTRFQSYAKDPDTQTNAVTVDSIQLVGRNL